MRLSVAADVRTLMSRVVLTCLWLAAAGCAETRPPPACWIGVFHHDGRNLELRADGRFRMTEKGCVFLTVDVKGRWTPRGTASVLRADGNTAIPWDMFHVIDQLDVRADAGNGIMVAAIPRIAPEVAKAAGGAGLPPELELKPFEARWMPGRVCTSCGEMGGTKVTACDEDPFGPW